MFIIPESWVINDEFVFSEEELVRSEKFTYLIRGERLSLDLPTPPF